MHQRSGTPDNRDVLPDGPGYFIEGAGAPVVMLHSSLSSKSQWTGLAARLASRFRVIAVDLCGYGDNAPAPAGPAFALDEEVRLVTAHLDRLVEPHVRVHLVGHSYGGLVGLRLAQWNSKRVASLTLYEPVVFRMLDDEDAALAAIGRLAERVSCLVATGRRDEGAQTFVDFWSGSGSYASLPPPTQAAIARRIDKVPLDFQAASGWPQDPADLHAIAAPTLLLAGDRSPMFMQRIITRLTRTLPNRHVRRFDSGHMGPITDAHRVDPWIEAFLDICVDGNGTPAPEHAVVFPETWASVAD